MEGGKAPPRASSAPRPLAGAQTIPSRNPKAPLPPRVSLVDSGELASVKKAFERVDAKTEKIERIEPESIESGPITLLEREREREREAESPPRSGTASIDGGKTAEQHALPSELQRALERVTGTAPPEPASASASTPLRGVGPPPAAPPSASGNLLIGTAPRDVRSTTEPNGTPAVVVAPTTRSMTAPKPTPLALNLKPGTGSLSPTRTPSPMAIVGGSLKIKPATDKPGNSGRPPGWGATPTGPELPPVIGPALGSGGRALPDTPAPIVRPSTAPGPHRPPTASRSFAPAAGGPPASYERAFRQWSAPAVDASEAPAGPVTFQVYTAKEIGAGRPPMRSRVLVEEKKPRFWSRLGLVLVAGIVVSVTAAAVVAVSSEDPKRPVAPTATTPPPPAAPAPAPAPTPTAISLGDPLDDPAPAPSANASAPAPSAAAPSVSVVRPKVRIIRAPAPAAASDSAPRAATAGTGSAPASLRGVAPPPNPYAK